MTTKAQHTKYDKAYNKAYSDAQAGGMANQECHEFAVDMATRASGVNRCQANRDGECEWNGCPQLKDGEPKQSGRHCPLDRGEEF
jgi:hypothetical protein